MAKKYNRRVHFIGIGGIGTSALAQWYLREGWTVSGSDIHASEITKNLKRMGVDFYEKAEAMPKTKPELVIYSPAVKEDNSEFAEAKRFGIKTLSYPQALGQLAEEKFSIAIAGTHGKSTTTSMLGLIMLKAELDPTVVVGTKLKEFGNSNFRYGKSNYLVLEACEHEASFLNYWPRMIILTNIEADHLDYYKNLRNIVRSFKAFVSHLGEDGILVANADDENVNKLLSSLKKPKFKVITFSFKQKEAEKLGKLLKVPGRHNVANALAALTAADYLNIPRTRIFFALSRFNGTWRRFQREKIRIGNKKAVLISDYAHHPTEVKSTFQAVREKFPKKRIICVFQPHQIQRTRLLFRDFVDVLKSEYIDLVAVTDIYGVAGREEKKCKLGIDSKGLVEAVKKNSVIYIEKQKILPFVRKTIRNGDILVFMGAGDIYELGKKIKRDK